MSERAVAAPEARVHGRGLAAALALGTGVGMTAIFTLGALGPFITTDLGLSVFAFGVLTTGMFVVASVVSPVVGRAVDVRDVRGMHLTLFVVVSAALVLLAAASDFVGVAVAAAIAGCALALSNPVTNAVITQRVASADRARLVGIAYTGPLVSTLLAGAALPLLARELGWRGAVLLTAGACLAAGLSSLLWILPAGVRVPASSRAEGGRAPVSMPWLNGYAFAMSAPGTALPLLVPLYAVEQLDTSPQLAGVALAALGLLGIPGRLCWMAYAQRTASPATALMLVAAGSVVAQAGVVASVFLGPYVLVAACCLLGLTVMAWMPLAMRAVIVTGSADGAGRAAGRVQRATFAGCAAGPLAFAALADVTGNYATPWCLAMAMFVTTCLLAGRAWRRGRLEERTQ